MHYFFVFYLCLLSLSISAHAQPLTTPQSQTVAELMGAKTPLWYVDTQNYRDGGMTLGTHAPTQDKYLILRYTRKEQGKILIFSLEHHWALPRDQACRATEKAIPYTHPQSGSWTLCSKSMPRTPQSVSIRGFAQNQTTPYLNVTYTGPASEFMALMSGLKRLPVAGSISASTDTSALESSRRFYPEKKQVQFNWPGYALGDEQLFWGKPTAAPNWIRAYHRAIPYIPQQITLHFTAVLRHTQHSQVVKPERPCETGQTKSRYEHPQLGPYLLCTRLISTPAHGSATDRTPLVHQVVYAQPLAGNKLPHLSFHIHGLPQDMLNMLGQVRLN